MAGIYITRGMTVGIPPGGFSLSIGDDGKLNSILTLHVRFDVCPTWIELSLGHLASAIEARCNRQVAWAGTDEDAKAAALEREFEASMQAIMAAAIALDAFYAILQPLTSISVAEFPDSALLLRAHELVEQLHLAHAVTESLDLPRKEETRNKVADILRSTRDIALTSVTEASHLLVQCSSKEELEVEWRILDERDKNYELTKRIYAEIRGSDDPSNPSFHPTASSKPRPLPSAGERLS